MSRPIVVLLPLLVFFSVISCGGKTPPPEPVQPSKDLQELVSRSVDSWLFLRMDETSWRDFKEKDWSLIENRLELVLEMKKYDWDIDILLEQIHNTELYKQQQPTEKQFIALVTEAMNSYSFEE